MSDAAARKYVEEPAPERETRAEVKTSDLPDPSGLPELRIYSRSTVFFWWPVWAAGYIIAAITAIWGETVTLSNGTKMLVHPNTGLGLSFIVVLILIMMLTNAKLRGIYSVVLLLSLAFVTVLFGWLGWWDRIFSFIPQLNVYMNLGFYLIFSTLLFAVWALRFLFFDRLVFWRLPARPAYRGARDRRRRAKL